MGSVVWKTKGVVAKGRGLILFICPWPPDFILFPGRAAAPLSAPDIALMSSTSFCPPTV
jgi:hypothetical protein